MIKQRKTVTACVLVWGARGDSGERKRRVVWRWDFLDHQVNGYQRTLKLTFLQSPSPRALSMYCRWRRVHVDMAEGSGVCACVACACISGNAVGLSLMWVGQDIKVGR